jgi:hypothetical protein
MRHLASLPMIALVLAVAACGSAANDSEILRAGTGEEIAQLRLAQVP